jgi:ATP-dependent DNA helicase RecG
MISMDDRQLSLFDLPIEAGENIGLWTPRDIWVRVTQRVMAQLGEDRRLDYKRVDYNRTDRIDFDDMAANYSAFSNTPDGGLLVFGATSQGIPTGCTTVPVAQLNRLEKFHVNRCPLARPEFKRFGVIVNDKQDFCIAVYVPYIGRLVETNKAEAWIRIGDSIHKMSEEEKQDFRATRHELAYELAPASNYNYPHDFEIQIIQDFCDSFRQRDSHSTWSNEEVLVDRNLAQREAGRIVPLNALVLMAAKNPRRTIPGCRVRVQRFGDLVEGSGQNYQPLVDRMAEGNIVEIFRLAFEIMKNTIYRVTYLNEAGKFVDTDEYPQMAWFEAIVNACVHRSYSFGGTEITVKFFPDRLEVESPGGFVPPVNEKTIYSARASRNYHLMDALRFLGYVRMGREGVHRIRDSMKENELPEPIFKQETLHGVVVRVTLKNEMRSRAIDRDVAQYFGVEVWITLSEIEVAIIGFAFRNTIMNVSDASRITGRTWQTSKKDLERLTKKNLLVFHKGKYTRDSSAHYRITERVTDTVRAMNTKP